MVGESPNDRNDRGMQNFQTCRDPSNKCIRLFSSYVFKIFYILFISKFGSHMLSYDPIL